MVKLCSTGDCLGEEPMEVNKVARVAGGRHSHLQVMCYLLLAPAIGLRLGNAPVQRKQVCF